MCGIVGVVYGPGGCRDEWTPSEAAELMFKGVEHRGRDAFGWMHYSGGGGSIALRKFAETASAGLDKLKPESEYGIPDDVEWWIGHVRLATHGTELNSVNNHPIVHGQIMGVHNGICYNYKEVLAQTGREHSKAEVDSEAIFAAINKYGIREGLDKLDALAATVWVDRAEPNVVYMATVDANPLCVATSKTGAVYFASEAHILESLGIEFEGEIWRLDDFSIAIWEDAKLQEYSYWADAQEQYLKHQRMGWGGYGGGWHWSDDDIEFTPSTKTTNDEHLDSTINCLDCGSSCSRWETYKAHADEVSCPRCGSDQLVDVYGRIWDGWDSEIGSGDGLTPDEIRRAEIAEALDKEADLILEHGKVYTVEEALANEMLNIPKQTADEQLANGEMTVEEWERINAAAASS